MPFASAWLRERPVLSQQRLTDLETLHEKSNLPVETMDVIDHYENIRRTYDFLKNSNILELINVYEQM